MHDALSIHDTGESKRTASDYNSCDRNVKDIEEHFTF